MTKILLLISVFLSLNVFAGKPINDKRYLKEYKVLGMKRPIACIKSFMSKDESLITVIIVPNKENGTVRFLFDFKNEEFPVWEDDNEQILTYHFPDFKEVYRNPFSQRLTGPDELAMNNIIQMRSDLFDHQYTLDLILQDGDDNLALTFDIDGILKELSVIKTSQKVIKGFWEGQVLYRGKNKIKDIKTYSEVIHRRE